MNWLEMTPAAFGYSVVKRRTVTRPDIKALHAHARRERARRERETRQAERNTR